MPELVHAEKIMEDKPDSALLLLEKMQPIDNVSDRERAIYFLLLTQAQDKNYITHTTDSLIQIAANYFESHNDVERTTLAYYYLGRVYSDMQDGLQAQECYLKAMELGEKIPNYQLLIKIYNSLGRLYAYQDIYEMALPMYKKALHLLQQEKDSSNICFALRNIARTFKMTKDIDSTIYYFHEAIRYTTPKSVSSVLKDLGFLYMDKNKYEEAIKYLNEAKILATNQTALYPIYLGLGKYFYKTNQLDSAQIYLTKSLNCPNIYTKATGYYYLIPIKKIQKNYIKYGDYVEQYIQLQDSIEKLSHFENIRIVQSMFNYQRIAKEKAKFEKQVADKKIESLQIIILFSIIIIIGFYLFRRDQIKKKHLIKYHQIQYIKSQHHIQDNEQQILSLEQEALVKKEALNKIQTQLFETHKLILEMENRQTVMNQGNIQILEKDFKASSVYLKAHSENCQLSQSEWAELHLLINGTYNDFTTRLLGIYSKMSTEELHICYLVKMGIPVKKIAKIMNITSSGVSQCRRRLYKKLTKEPENAEKFDTFIADF